jgi:hypothetical protein
MRNLKAEVEMTEICKEVWQKIGIGKMPEIESKQGGHTAIFSPSQFKVIFRWNSWNKMPLAGKRLVAIHELYHALGRNHDSAQMFCNAHDMLAEEFYKAIYGEDDPLRDAMAGMRQIAESVMKESYDLKMDKMARNTDFEGLREKTTSTDDAGSTINQPLNT